MQGNLARPVWGWGQGEIPGPTPPFIGRGKAGCLAVILLTFVGKAHRYHMDPWLYVEFAGAGRRHGPDTSLIRGRANHC